MTEQTSTSAKFSDRERGMGWWWFFFPHIHLDLSSQHARELERDLQRHTRLLFDVMFTHTAHVLQLRSAQRPRTDDPSWHPLIESRCEGPALTVLHRMHYQPTRESVMGHTLVPVEGGLFEARWLCMAQTTGYRESALMLTSMSDDGEPKFLPQSAYDDESHDARFPQHPLSLARSVARWHVDAGLKVTKPPVSSDGEIDIAPLQCAIRVPPRFLPAGVTSSGTSFVFTRVAFSGTDGVDRLIVTRTSERIRGIAVGYRLAKYAERHARAEHEDLANLSCRATPVGADVQVVTEGDPKQVGCGRVMAVSRWFLDDDGIVWSICLATTVAVPGDELAADVAAIRHSWRRC